MKIVSSFVAAAPAASPAPAEVVQLSVIPAASAPGVSAEELTEVKNQLQAVREDLKKWREECQDAFAREIVKIKQEWQAQLESSAENSKKSIAPLEKRLSALEQMPRFAEEHMLQKIKESVKKEWESNRPPAPAAAPIPAPPQDAWDSDLKRKEKTLQDLKTELAKMPAVANPVLASPVPAAPALVENRPVISEAPAKLDIDGLKKHLTQESTYGTSSRTHSIFAKLWLYLNESAIEIPVKASKDNS